MAFWESFSDQPYSNGSIWKQPEEKARHKSVFCHFFHCEWEDCVPLYLDVALSHFSTFCYFVFSAGLEESQDKVDRVTGALRFIALLLERSVRDAGMAGKLECHIPFSRAQQQASVLLLHSRGSRVMCCAGQWRRLNLEFAAL